MKRTVILMLWIPIIGFPQLKVEWLKEITDFPNNYLSGIIGNGENILVATGAGVQNFSHAGDELGFSEASSGVYSMQKSGADIFTIGYMDLERRDHAGKKTSNVILYQSGNSYLSARNGQVYNTHLYTTHNYNYFIRYDLSGKQIFRKEIAKASDNKYLQTGGGHVYIFSHISDPPLGGRLMQYDTLGNQKWSLSMSMVNNILADKSGNCYVFSLVPQKSNIVSKYDTEGNLLWSKEVSNQTVGNGFLHGDSLLVCGIETIEAANGNMQNPAFSILSAKDGKILYQQKLDFYSPEESAEAFTQITTDGKAIYLGGQTGGQSTKCFLVKLSPEGNTTGIKDEKAPKNSFSIFPNPGGSRFTISCGNNELSTVHVTVRNISGQVVYNKKVECNTDKRFTLDLGKQSSGTYTVEIVSGKDRTVNKVVVE